MARLNLALVGELVSHLPDQAILARATYRAHDDLLGGDATVMLTPASTSWPADHTRPVAVELPTDVRPPLDVLTVWVNRWKARTSHSYRPNPPGLAWAVEHLASQLHLIGQTDLFAPMARDLSSVVHQLENVLHAGERPDVSSVPCWDCGSQLHKIWTDQPAHDHWRCPACGQLYDQGRYERAQHDQLASRGADRYVPLTDAASATGRSEQTIRNWRALGLIESRRSPSSGRVEVWWPDVRQRHLTVATRARKDRRG
jgi:hypothetical protein